MQSRLERLNMLIGYLIYTGDLSCKAIQKEIADKLNANKVNISKALNGNEDYLTDSFIERFNTAFGSPFDKEWLLKGEGFPPSISKNIQNNHDESHHNVQNNYENFNIKELYDLLRQRDDEIKRIIYESHKQSVEKDNTITEMTLLLKESQRKLFELTDKLLNR
jgi:transcriptional regulator with XRE-family HTH domain